MECDKFQFYYKSADKYPGEGAGEFVNNKNDYIELSKIPNWRRVFSSLFLNELVYLDKRYGSFEHAFQAQKFAVNGYNDIAFSFTLDSGSNLGKGSGLDARRARKIVKLNNKELEKWEENRRAIKDELYRIKYSSGLPLKILKLTKQAELYSYPPRGKKIRCERLEKIRNDKI